MLSETARLRHVVMTWLETRHADEQGASLVEYALILAFVVIVAIGAIALVGSTNASLLNNAAHAVAHP